MAGRLLVHLDRNPDPELHADIAARGVTLEYDTIGRIKYRPDSDLLDLIESVVAAGHLERIVLGLDLAGATTSGHTAAGRGCVR